MSLKENLPSLSPPSSPPSSNQSHSLFTQTKPCSTSLPCHPFFTDETLFYFSTLLYNQSFLSLHRRNVVLLLYPVDAHEWNSRRPPCTRSFAQIPASSSHSLHFGRTLPKVHSGSVGLWSRAHGRVCRKPRAGMWIRGRRRRKIRRRRKMRR